MINARTDTYFCAETDDIVAETIKCGLKYKAAGADCLFVPGLNASDEILKISKAVDMRLNIMNVPGIPNIENLKNSGVTFLSLGNSAFDDVIMYFENCVQEINESRKYSDLYKHKEFEIKM